MSSPDGIKLKKDLGLNNFKNVGVSYVYKSNPRIYIVWVNSFNPSVPITKTYIKTFNQLTIHANTDELDYSFPIDIEQFGGNIRSAYFIVHDLAGSKLANDRMREWKKEEPKKPPIKTKTYWFGNLQELTISDFRDEGNVSAFTTAWRTDRSRVMGGGATRNTKLLDCVVDVNKKTVQFQFLTEATELNGKKPSKVIGSSYKFYGGDKAEIDPSSKKLKRNPSKSYELWLQFDDIIGSNGWLSTFTGDQITKKEMMDIIETSEAVKVWSSSPSFLLQGFAYWTYQVDGGIVPEDRKPQRWDKYHGDGDAFLDKHLASLFRSIRFFIPQMAQMLNKKLKDRGLI